MKTNMMKTNTKKLVLTSLGLIILGAILTGMGMLLGGRPGVVLSRDGFSSPYKKYEPFTLDKTKIEEFSNVELKIGSYADVRILPSKDDNFYLEYQLDGVYGEPSFDVKGETLSLTHSGNARSRVGIYNFYIGNFDVVNDEDINAYIALYIPEGADMGNLEVYNDSGDVSIENLSFGDTKLDVSYGDVNLRDMSFQDLDVGMECGNFDAKAFNAQDFVLKNEYGEVSLEKVAVRDAEISLDSGGMKADDFACAALTAEDEYGDIELKRFSAETAGFVLDSGNLYLDAEELTNLTCKSEYGDVTIKLPKDLEEYSVSVRSEYGHIELPDKAPGQHISSDDEAIYTTQGKSEGKITIEAESGDVEIQ